MDFMIGGLAGAGATIFTNPIDVVKTRLQLQGELRERKETKTRYRGLVHALYVIAKTEGVLALQKGLVPAMFFGFCMNSVRLGSYHIAEVQGWTKNNKDEITVTKAILWSAISGGTSGIVSNPFSVVKTRVQAASHPSIAVGRQYSYKGMWDGLITLYKTEGLRGYLSGANATCVRLAIGSGVQLTTFSKSKQTLLKHGICEDSPLGLAFLASALSGIGLSLIICPMDVVTVRLYNQGGSDQGKQLYSGMMNCILQIYRKEGLYGFYKGLGPLYFRLAPHTTLSLMIWDMFNDLFNNKI